MTMPKDVEGIKPDPVEMAKQAAVAQSRKDFEFFREKAGQARWVKEHEMLDTPAPVEELPDMSDLSPTEKNLATYFEGKAELVKLANPEAFEKATAVKVIAR